MKIGILTTHDSVNYGAVLQAYAMRSVLTAMGHDAVVIDRRRSKTGSMLRHYRYESRFVKFRRLIGFAGGWIDLLRRLRTMRFLIYKVSLTNYHFCSWNDAPMDLGIDAIVVGSDQVWNRNINNPLDYMPTELPRPVPCVSYAASLGMGEIPSDLQEGFKKRLCKFTAVSVREKPSVQLLAALGIKAEHVVDPVVLAGNDIWNPLAGSCKKVSGKVVVYSLGIGPLSVLEKQMSDFSKRHGCPVDILTGGEEYLAIPSVRRPFDYLRNFRYWVRLFLRRTVNVRVLAGPMQFLQSLASAETVVTNSYHALVFSVLFGKNVRYVIPKNEGQKAMMVRIYEYAESIVRGPLLQPSLDAALASIAKGEKTSIASDILESRRQASIKWLKNALEGLRRL